MFKFLFRKRDTKVVVETQRQSFERIVTDLNEAIDGLPVKPRVTVDPETGHVELHLPEQMPDEALALPAPEENTGSEEVEAANDTTPETVPEEAESKVA